jgi:hypothetical protein
MKENKQMKWITLFLVSGLIGLLFACQASPGPKDSSQGIAREPLVLIGAIGGVT